MATHVAFLPPQIRALIQENHLTAMIRQPLVPKNQFRTGIARERWDAKTGESRLINRNGTLAPVTVASTPRVEAAIQSTPLEQWPITAENLQGAIEVDVRQNFHTVVDEFERNMAALGLQAGTSLARWARAKIFQAGLAGHTWLTAGANPGDRTITVFSIDGFTQRHDALLNRLSPVSATNALRISVGGELVNVIGAAPADATRPHGAGILTLDAALAAGHAMNSVVLASTRSRVIRAGGGTSSRALVANDVLLISHINSAVAHLRTLGVPTFADGHYRVHLSPESVRQLREDAAWQLQVRGVPDHQRVTEFEVGRISGCVFVENAESPTRYNVLSTEDFPGAITAAQTGGQNVARAIVYGADSIYEHYVPELEFETIPGSAEFGKREMLGNWVDTGDYVKGLVEGILFAFRRPQDQKGERSTVTWSWTGDFGVPTDLLAQVADAAIYKRQVVIEHADLS